MIEEHRQQTPDFRAAAFRQRQATKPGFHFYRSHSRKIEGSPLRNDPSLAQTFRLKFSDVFDYGNSPVRFNGHTLTFEESKALADAMDPHIERLNHLADSIVDPFEPWTNANSKYLDKTSLVDWLASLKCPTGAAKKGCAALEQQLVADNGRPAEQQSLLGVLAMIKGHGVDRYWTDTEVYRCIGGNAQLAQKFRDALGEEVVHTGIKVTAISEKNGIVSVELAHTTEQDQDKDLEPEPNSRTPKAPKGKKLKPVRADEVILAIPPSVWHLIHFKNLDLRRKTQASSPPRRQHQEHLRPQKPLLAKLLQQSHPYR
jgi:monoamine oxidase